MKCPFCNFKCSYKHTIKWTSYTEFYYTCKYCPNQLKLYFFGRDQLYRWTCNFEYNKTQYYLYAVKEENFIMFCTVPEHRKIFKIEYINSITPYNVAEKFGAWRSFI